ncbi:MAG TPA: 2-oxo acid dehydrogenase subunit E2 [Clostridiales bacterium]|nr:2-oxo acid dehydrogenase subunit E2 [Clostridiales bacterium]
MAEKVFMTALSPTMEEGILARWHKKEGDRVEAGDILCEVETDKATMDYESTAEGILLKILVQEGEKAAVGEVIAIIGDNLGDISQILDDGDSSQKIDGGDSSQELSKNDFGDSSQIYIKNESIKAYGDTRIKASPLARRIAEMNKIDLSDINGSGPAGRIVKADIERYMKDKLDKSNVTEISSMAKGYNVTEAQKIEIQQGKEQQAFKISTPVQAVVAAVGDIEIPVSQKRKIIAQRLSESKFSAPHYYLTVSVNVDNLIQTRKRLNESLQEKVSFNAFFIKYAAEALKKHPMVNATWNGDTIIQRKQVDIGLAVAQPDGLITPVVRDCGNKGVIAINKELLVLIEKARNNKLAPDEYQNAGFTISNLGSFGIEEFTAVINPPGSAILAVGEMKKVPAVDQDDNITIQTQMKMTLSCDHRVIDGAAGAAFLKDLKDIIEDPIRALF